MQQTHSFRSWVSLKRIFLSQCVDHAVSLAFAFFLLFVALSFTQSPLLETLSGVSPNFWVAFLSTLFVASLVQRAFFVLMFGASFGNLCFHLKPLESARNRQFWVGHIIESLQLTFPLLWLIEMLSRNGSHRRSAGLRYRFHHS